MLILPLGAEDDGLESSDRGAAWLTWTCLAILGLAFLVQELALSGPVAREAWRILAFSASDPVGPGMLGHVLLHADGPHLLGNGLFLTVFGVTVERRLGRSALLAAILAGTVSGALVHAATAPRGAGPLVGASGAVMGLVGLLLPALPTLRLRLLIGLVWWRVFSVPAFLVVLGFFVAEMLGAFWYGPTSRVAYPAHLGGIAGGALLGLFWPELARVGEGVSRRLGLERITWRTPEMLRGPMAASLPFEFRDYELPADPDEVEDREASGSGTVREAPERPEPEPEEPGGGASVLLPVALGAVPPEQDLTHTSGVWAKSWHLADLQARFEKARAMEKDREGSRVAFVFYARLLRDEELPPGYRALAGARLARMLLRARRYREARGLGERLLANPMAPELEAHVQETLRSARRRLARQQAG